MGMGDPLLNSHLRFSIPGCSEWGKTCFWSGRISASFMSLSWNNSKPPSMPFKMQGVQLVADGAVASPKCKGTTNSSRSPKLGISVHPLALDWSVCQKMSNLTEIQEILEMVFWEKDFTLSLSGSPPSWLTPNAHHIRTGMDSWQWHLQPLTGFKHRSIPRSGIQTHINPQILLNGSVRFHISVHPNQVVQQNHIERTE